MNGRGPSERRVQAIWYDASLRPQRLLANDGREVYVASPGEWNGGAGPDFLGAVLEVGPERQRLAGDVEVHICPRDWDLHRHGSDPAYRNVVAHVTWHSGDPPTSLPPGAISIWLGRIMEAQSDFAPDAVDPSAYPSGAMPLDSRPCEKGVGHDPEAAKAILSEFGRRRLRMKARRIAGRLCEASARSAATRSDVSASRRQVFYEEVMTALGYGRNAGGFRRVAAMVPIADMPADVAAAKTALLVAGGFEPWDRSGYRPWNTPETRLSAAADVFRLTDTMSLADACDFSRGACEEMMAEMRGRHLTRGDVPSLMGRGRAAAIVANVILPFAMAEGRATEPPDWLPPEDVSRPVRLAASRLFGRDHNPPACYSSNGMLIQGLLEMNRMLCLRRYPDCGGCPLSARSA